MNSRLLVAAIMLVSATFVAADELALHRGVSITVPNGWRVAEKWESQRSKDSQVFADPAAGEAVTRSSGQTESLVILAKHPSDHVGLNPSIHVSRTALPHAPKGLTPEKVIEAALPSLTRAFHDVRVDQWLPNVKVGDRSAAKATVVYNQRGTSGRVTPARASVIVVLDGDGFFIIGYSSPSEGKDDAGETFARFVSAVRFERPAA